MTLSIGEKAPDFTLKTKTSEGLEDVTLSEHNNKEKCSSFIFSICLYWRMYRGGLFGKRRPNILHPTRCKSLWHKRRQSFRPRNYVAKGKFKFSTSSDFNKDVSKSYGVLYEDFIGFVGVSKRSAFVISKEGIILYAWSSDDPKQLPDFSAIKASIS